MRKWLKWLLIPALLIIVVAGVQGFYSYKVKSGLDKFLASLSPFARISYDEISSLIMMPIVVKGITIQPNPYSDIVLAKEAELTFSDWTTGLSLHTQLQQGIISDFITLSLTGIAYDLNADYALSNSVESDSEVSLNTLLCGNETRIDSEDLQAMGYGVIAGNVQLMLEPSANKELVKVQMSGQVAGFAEGEVNLWLGVTGSRLSRRELANSSIRLFGLNLRDKGFNQRWQQYCGQQSGQKIDYLSAYRSELENWLTKDFQIDQGLLDALVSVRSPGSIAAARLEPASPVKIGKLAAAGMNDNLFSRSDFAVQINGKVFEVKEQDWAVIKGLFAGDVREAAIAVMIDPPVEEVVTKKNSPLREIVPGVIPIRVPLAEKSYQLTKVSDLSAYKGSAVKIKTFFGREMEGILVSVTGETVSIRRHIEQGKVTYPITKDKISHIEVYR